MQRRPAGLISTALALALAVALAGAARPAASQSAAGRAPAAGFQAVCAPAGQPCRVDAETYIGWRVFERECAVCHASGGVGSRFAPDLTERVPLLDRADFVTLIADGYRGGGDLLPPHGEKRDVARYVAELWSYLSARATGRLPPGPVEPLPVPAAAGP